MHAVARINRAIWRTDGSDPGRNGVGDFKARFESFENCTGRKPHHEVQRAIRAYGRQHALAIAISYLRVKLCSRGFCQRARKFSRSEFLKGWTHLVVWKWVVHGSPISLLLDGARRLPGRDVLAPNRSQCAPEEQYETLNFCWHAYVIN